MGPNKDAIKYYRYNKWIFNAAAFLGVLNLAGGIYMQSLLNRFKDDPDGFCQNMYDKNRAELIANNPDKDYENVSNYIRDCKAAFEKSNAANDHHAWSFLFFGLAGVCYGAGALARREWPEIEALSKRQKRAENNPPPQP